MEERICTNCGKSFKKYAKPAKHYFCCRKCYNDWKKGENNPNWRGGDIKHVCHFCKKEFGVRRDRASSQSGKYCSSQCYENFVKSISMSETQVNLAKMTLTNLTYWLRNNSSIKTNWIERYGYLPEDFKQHIESLWKPGMMWSNYATVWCLDHTKPIQFFTFLSREDEDFKKCFALSNLQPLFNKENALKGRKDHEQNIYWRG